MSRKSRRHYFSIESILASEEQLQCTVLATDNRLGFLDPGCPSESLSPGAKLSLPYWVACCCNKHTRLVSVEIPLAYKKSYRDIFHADPTVVNIKSLCRFFYILGEYLIRSRHREAPEIRALLTMVLRRRFRMIMQRSLHCSSDIVKKLDWTELIVFNASKHSQDVMNTWLTNDVTMQASSMITTYKKRKITQKDMVL